MRHLLTALLGVALVATAARGDAPGKADAKAAPVEKSFGDLKKEFDDATDKFSDAGDALLEEFKAAKTDEERKKIREKAVELQASAPGPKFAPRFLAFAEQNPKAPEAFDALALALRNSDAKQKESVKDKVVARLQSDYVTRPEIKQVVRALASNTDEPSLKVVETVAEKNPDREVQAAAVQALARGRDRVARMGGQLKDNANLAKAVEAQKGKAFVEKFLADAEQAKKDAEKWGEVLKKKYPESVVDLSVGKAAPEAVSHDLAGKEVRLSSLRGKVVVLDIWATWCGPCKAMIPHEREMVGRFKDKPFALVSISADAKKKTLTKFLEKESMPWTQWWSGNDGGIIEDWEIDHFPTIYVLDAKGVIRYKEIRGEELEKAVEKLLKDMGVDVDAAKKG